MAPIGGIGAVGVFRGGGAGVVAGFFGQRFEACGQGGGRFGRGRRGGGGVFSSVGVDGKRPHRQAAKISVLEKSSPLNSSGSPERFAKA